MHYLIFGYLLFIKIKIQVKINENKERDRRSNLIPPMSIARLLRSNKKRQARQGNKNADKTGRGIQGFFLYTYIYNFVYDQDMH